LRVPVEAIEDGFLTAAAHRFCFGGITQEVFNSPGYFMYIFRIHKQGAANTIKQSTPQRKIRSYYGEAGAHVFENFYGHRFGKGRDGMFTDQTRPNLTQ
jgi:hypothetical protein